MRVIMDGFTEPGANRLAYIITNYWADKGYKVDCRAKELSVQLSPRATSATRIWCVRSDMVNGVPTTRKLQKLAA